MFKLKNLFSETLVLFLFISALTALFSLFVTQHIFGDITFEQVFIHLTGGLTGVGSGIIKKYVFQAFLPALIISLMLFAFSIKKRWLVVGAVLCFAYCISELKVISYFLNQNIYTEFYEKNYVDPKNLHFSFPQNKRNLIILYMESMDQNSSDPDIAGSNLIPNLSARMAQNTSFENFHQISDQSYTIAAMVEGFCGVAYRMSHNSGLNSFANFLPQLTCYPEILRQNGWSTHVIKSTDMSFAQMGVFFTSHGFDNVLNIDKLSEKYGFNIKENMGTSWGLRDSFYYDLAKAYLTEIAAKKQPFVLTMITLDTHNPDIYLDPKCPTKFGHQKDVIFCADQMASEFLDWLSEQDFYSNSVVVVLGDHPDSGSKLGHRRSQEAEIVNFIINSQSSLKADQARQWTTLDLAPTILNALGIRFDQGAFGLGRSLFADQPTLFETYGLSLDTELNKASELYENFTSFQKIYEPPYAPYPVWGEKISDPEKISTYASLSETLLDTLWCDELSFTLEIPEQHDLQFSMLFQVLLMEDKFRRIEVYANGKLIKTLDVSIGDKQPISAAFEIPFALINDNKLLLEFKSGQGYTPASVGIGIKNFALDLN